LPGRLRRLIRLLELFACPALGFDALVAQPGALGGRILGLPEGEAGSE
jgi:hypothetical protein